MLQDRARHDASTPLVLTLLSQLDERLRSDRAGFHRSLAPGASPARLAALENVLGVELPVPLYLMLLWRDGLRDLAERREGLYLDYEPLGTAAIARASVLLREMHEQGLWRGWVSAHRAERIPFAASPRGDWLVVDAGGAAEGTAGRVLRTRLDSPDLDVRFRNLEAFLETAAGCSGRTWTNQASRRSGVRMLAAARELRP